MFAGYITEHHQFDSACFEAASSPVAFFTFFVEGGDTAASSAAEASSALAAAEDASDAAVSADAPAGAVVSASAWASDRDRFRLLGVVVAAAPADEDGSAPPAAAAEATFSAIVRAARSALLGRPLFLRVGVAMPMPVVAPSSSPAAPAADDSDSASLTSDASRDREDLRVGVRAPPFSFSAPGAAAARLPDRGAGAASEDACRDGVRGGRPTLRRPVAWASSAETSGELGSSGSTSFWRRGGMFRVG